MKTKEKRKKLVNISQHFIGDEPRWENEQNIAKSLSWYANQQESNDSKKYTLEYLKENEYDNETIEKISGVKDCFFGNLGFVCRILKNGAPLTERNYEWIKEKIEILLKRCNDKEYILNDKIEVSIQDKIYLQSTIFINEIEEYIENFIKNKKFNEFNCYEYLIFNQSKNVHARQIKTYFEPLFYELQLAIDRSDEQINESYSKYTKKEITNYYNFINNIINDCDRISNISKITRKPRKKKKISVDKVVSKVQYKKEDLELKLKSIDPINILTATQVWLYNIKYRKLGVLNVIGNGNFSIKGTTIYGFDEVLSIQKMIRKPEELLKEIVNAKKSDMKQIMKKIKTKESNMTGRLNNDTIILKVFK